MSDKELLELAAKALGNAKIKWNGAIWCNCERMNRPDERGNSYPSEWNPLTDDGDALRLAVKLEMNVDIGPHFTEASMIRDDTRIGADERHDDDPFAATRRAIVLAAAEIGKAMP